MVRIRPSRMDPEEEIEEDIEEQIDDEDEATNLSPGFEEKIRPPNALEGEPESVTPLVITGEEIWKIDKALARIPLLDEAPSRISSALFSKLTDCLRRNAPWCLLTSVGPPRSHFLRRHVRIWIASERSRCSAASHLSTPP